MNNKKSKKQLSFGQRAKKVCETFDEIDEKEGKTSFHVEKRRVDEVDSN